MTRFETIPTEQFSAETHASISLKNAADYLYQRFVYSTGWNGVGDSEAVNILDSLSGQIYSEGSPAVSAGKFSIFDCLTKERVSDQSYATVDEANHDYYANAGHTYVDVIKA